MKRIGSFGILVLLTFTITARPTMETAWGDCGSVPFAASPKAFERLTKAIEGAVDIAKLPPAEIEDFDPLEVRVFEPHQRAIILWNGDEQILLLSTDQKASQVSAVLEVIPLPSEPTVRLGDFESFNRAERLVIERCMWVTAHGGAKAEMVKAPTDAGKITFHEKMGVHDVSVAKVIHAGGFVQFVQNYLKERYGTARAPIRGEFVGVIESYLDQQFQWFAFDVIQLEKETLRSREPLEYRFKSESVFYPMRISTLEQGDTEIRLLVVSDRVPHKFKGLGADSVEKGKRIPLTLEDVKHLDKTWEGFFDGEAEVFLHQWTIKGDISQFVKDVVVM